MKKRILHLTLKRIYFDQIAHDIKKVEYREIKSYWTTRLFEKGFKPISHKRIPKKFDEIWFTNGYGKKRPFMRVEWKDMDFDVMFEGKHCYAIKLGKVLEFKNYEYVV